MAPLDNPAQQMTPASKGLITLSFLQRALAAAHAGNVKQIRETAMMMSSKMAKATACRGGDRNNKQTNKQVWHLNMVSSRMAKATACRGGDRDNKQTNKQTGVAFKYGEQQDGQRHCLQGC
jgi:hypothetical protein